MRFVRVFNTLIVLLLFVGVVLSGFVREFARDFHWHLVVGGWTLDNHQVFRNDVFSYTFPGRAALVGEWLGDVLFALAYRTGGYIACYGMRALSLVATFLLLFRELRERGLSTLATTAVLLSFLATAFMHFYLRPETISFLFLAAMLHLVGEYERTQRKGLLVGYLLLIGLWGHVHGSTPVGLFYSGCFFLEHAIRSWRRGPTPEARREMWIALAMPPIALGVSMLHPEGWRFPFLAFISVSHAVCYKIAEFLPFSADTMDAPFRLFAAGVLATCVLAGRRVSLWLLASTLVTILVTLRHNRMATTAMIVSLPLVGHNLVQIAARLKNLPRGPMWLRLASAGGVGLILWSVASAVWGQGVLSEVGLGVDKAYFPISACEFANQKNISGRVLNSYNTAGYLMFCKPGQLLAVDQRGCAFYPGEYLERYFASFSSVAAARAFTDELKATWSFSENDAIAAALSRDPERWRLVYFDDNAFIFVRHDDPRYATLLEDSFTVLNPLQLGRIAFASDDERTVGERELSRQLARCKDCFTSHLLDAALALAAHDVQRAKPALTRARVLASQKPQLVFLEALALAEEGKLVEAGEHHLGVLALGGELSEAVLWAAFRFDQAGEQKKAKAMVSWALAQRPDNPLLQQLSALLTAGQPLKRPGASK